MRVLLVHPSPLMFSEIYLRLEPLGLERVATAIAAAGHDVCSSTCRCSASGIMGDLANWRPRRSASRSTTSRTCRSRDARARGEGGPPRVPHHGRWPQRVLRRARPARACRRRIDCVVRGEGKGSPARAGSVRGRRGAVLAPGRRDARRLGPPPLLIPDSRRTRGTPPGRPSAPYFIGELDPCASIEFTRGCPWDCTSAAPGRSTDGAIASSRPSRRGGPGERREPNCFIVDDVAFIRARTAWRSPTRSSGGGSASATTSRRGPTYWLRNREVFERWRGSAPLHVPRDRAIDERASSTTGNASIWVTTSAHSRSRASSAWSSRSTSSPTRLDERRFAVVREWALEFPRS